MATTPDVATRSATQEAMCEAAALPRALAGGTKAMRAAGETYLPRNEAESVKGYDARKNRTFLFNGLGKTVDDMTGKVFDKPITLEDDVPEQIKVYAENIDNAGRHLNVFARDVFADAMIPGIGYILVDVPRGPIVAPGQSVTIAQERVAGVRPYLSYIPVERLIGWKSTTIAGVETLTQVRIKECVREPDGEFNEKEVDQIRVIDPGYYRVFRKGTSDKWIVVEEGATTLKKVTLVPVYLNRTGFMTGSPPLQKLAELNVAHWQSSSEQRNILHVARVPILFGSGWNTEDKIAIGADSMIRVSDASADLKYVEHTGESIGAGREDLKDLEFQMQTMGLQLLIPSPGGDKSATGEVRDDAKENSTLAMMARSLGDAIEQAFGYMAEYIALGENAGGSVDVNTDYGIKAGALADIPNILAARTAGLLTRETAWLELQRRGFLSDSFDPEAEAATLDTEAPELDGGPGRKNELDE